MRARTFWLANLVILLDEVLYLALIPLLPDLSAEFGLSKAQVGFLYGAYPLLVLLSSIPAGLVVDRVGVRTMLLLGCALLVVATVGFAYAHNAWHVWVARAVQGLTAGLVATAGMAAVASGADPARRATTIGVAVSLQGLSGLVGYAVGGLLAPSIGIREAFLVPAALGLVVFVALLLDRTTIAPVGQPLRFRRAVVDPLRSVAVREMACCLLAVGLAGSAVQTLTALGLSEAGYSTAEIGVTFVIAAVAAFLASPLAGLGADRAGTVRALRAWTLAMPATVAGLAVAGHPLVIASLLVAALSFVRVGGVLAYARGAEYRPLGAGLAAGYGIAVSAWSVGAVAGPLLAGVVADVLSDGVALGTIAVLTALVAVPVWRRGQVDRSPATR